VAFRAANDEDLLRSEAREPPLDADVGRHTAIALELREVLRRKGGREGEREECTEKVE